MTGREYLELKSIKIENDWFDGCPSDYGLKIKLSVCNESGDGCAECIREALESEVEE